MSSINTILTECYKNLYGIGYIREYSKALTIPLILSYINYGFTRQQVFEICNQNLLKNVLYENIYRVYRTVLDSHGGGIDINKVTHVVPESLHNLTYDSIYNRNRDDVDILLTPNEYDIGLNIDLLSETLGICGKKNYIARTNIALSREIELDTDGVERYVQNIDIMRDAQCYNLQINDCTRNNLCGVRTGDKETKCVQKELIRTFNEKEIGKDKNYYIFEYMNKNYLYKPLFMYKTSLGYCYLLEETLLERKPIYSRREDRVTRRIITVQTGEEIIQKPTKKYRFFFPPFGTGGITDVQGIIESFRKLYLNARLTPISDPENVAEEILSEEQKYPENEGKVHYGMLNIIKNLFNKSVPKLDNPSKTTNLLRILKGIFKDPDSVLFISGCSLGGGLANVFYSYIMMFNIDMNRVHLHAYGAPRVFDKEFSAMLNKKMSARSVNLSKLSCIYDPILNDSKQLIDCKITGQFDFITKFPIKERGFSDNPKLRGVCNNFIFVPAYMFKNQPDYDFFGIVTGILKSRAKHKAEETRVSWNNCANKQGMNHSIETYTSKRIFNYGIDYNMSILLVIDGVEYAIDKAENDSKENVLLDIHRYYGIGGPGENEYVLINKTTNLNLTLVSRDGVKTNFVLNRNTGVNLIKQKVPIFETEIIINGQECSDVSLPVHDTLSTLFDYATGAVNKAKRLIW